MTKKGKKTRKGKGSSAMSSLEFTSYQTASLASGLATIQVRPQASMSSRFLQFADEFAMYRMKSLRFRLIRVGSITSVQIACYIPGITDTLPQNLSDASEVPCKQILSGVITTQMPWVKVSKQALHGYQDWYKTIPGTSVDSNAEQVGSIQIVGTATDTYAIEIHGVAEFADPVAASNTPEIRALRDKVRVLERQERARKEAEKLRASGIVVVTGK